MRAEGWAEAKRQRPSENQGTMRKHERILGHAPRRIDRKRAAMIAKVRTIWIDGILKKSLFNDTRIILGLSERHHAVVRPVDLLVRRPNHVDRPLSLGTKVIDVFDWTAQSLLILGAPGAGKTTLLLELARDLLDRAESDPSHPLPVVFPLSTWGQSRKSLTEWLGDEPEPPL